MISRFKDVSLQSCRPDLPVQHRLLVDVGGLKMSDENQDETSHSTKSVTHKDGFGDRISTLWAISAEDESSTWTIWTIDDLDNEEITSNGSTTSERVDARKG